MVPVPRVKSLAEFNQKLRKDCLNYRGTHKVESRAGTVAETYNEECFYLKQIPAYRSVPISSTPLSNIKCGVLIVENPWSMAHNKMFCSLKYINRPPAVTASSK